MTRGFVAALLCSALLLAPRGASARTFVSFGIQPLALGSSTTTTTTATATATATTSSESSAVAPYDVIGTLAIPLIAGGMYGLGHLIDGKLHSDPNSPDSGVWGKVFVVLGVGIDYVGMKYLGDGLGVPTSWASTAVGFAFGFAAAGVFVGLDAACIALFGLDQSSPVVGLLALAAIVAWSITTSVITSTDPFHLADPTKKATTATTTAPLLSLAF